MTALRFLRRLAFNFFIVVVALAAFSIALAGLYFCIAAGALFFGPLGAWAGGVLPAAAMAATIMTVDGP